jgi:hypothetical protein
MTSKKANGGNSSDSGAVNNADSLVKITMQPECSFLQLPRELRDKVCFLPILFKQQLLAGFQRAAWDSLWSRAT